MEIVWSETALETFLRVIDYLFDNWSKIEINKFDEDVDNLLEKIVVHNELCPESKLNGYRKCIIDEYNSLV